MLKPKQIDKLPEALIELYSQVEMDIIADMARRISGMDYFVSAAQWQYRKLIEMGNCHGWIMQALSAQTGKSRREIERMMEEAGVKTIRQDAIIYKRAGLSPPELAASPVLQTVLIDGIHNTEGLFENITGTTANTATKQFERALDRAWLQVQSGAFSQEEAIRMAIKDLAKKGVECIVYPSGHVDHMDVAVRRAAVTGANQTALRLQDTLADEMGCDLVEVTAHAGARTGKGIANHAAWQGKVYSRSGNSSKYPPLVESTGYGTGAGLGGWNCRHSWFVFFEGISDPAYTQAELDEMNAKKYTYNGEKLSEYEASQKQRAIERNIRRWKREYKAMEAAGLDPSEAAAKLSGWQEKQRDFLSQTGLKRQAEREWVEGFGRREAARANASTKNVTKPEIHAKLNDKDIYAIDQYKSARSYRINAGLRGEGPLSDADKAIVQDIDNAIQKLPVYEGTVYRSLSSDMMIDADSFWERYRPGSIVVESAYTSVSESIYDDGMDIQMVIQSKRGRDMREYNPNESEVLFPRDTKFKVVKVEGTTIFLEEET